MKPAFALELIKNDQSLRRLADALPKVPVFAVDLETTQWWNRNREQIALVQIAYRNPRGESRVAVIDALAKLDFAVLKTPFEDSATLKVIHNASFDAPRLAKHYRFQIAPVHDTMLAARAGKESKYSLKAQAAIHLGIHLDKAAQKSDWSRRPLDPKQLYYAALDAHAALLLYEHQIKRNLRYEYRLRKSNLQQGLLPLDDAREIKAVASPSSLREESAYETELTDLSAALLGIAAELPTRYSPDSLAASLGGQRTGLAGWIIDRRLGRETELDEETIKLAIADLCERNLLLVTETRRLVVTAEGAQIWQGLKDG